MTDSARLSAAAGLPTPAEDGTPAGHPTPAGEPASIQLDLEDWQPEQAEPVAASPTGADLPRDDADQAPAAMPAAGDDPCHAIGALVLAWGALESATAEKLMAMRKSFGDVRVIGGRSRPTLQRLLAELRALVAMRDRHDKQALTVIAALDGDLQRIAQFRMLVVEGAQGIEDGAVVCHDLKNVAQRVTAGGILKEAGRIDGIRAQIEGL